MATAAGAAAVPQARAAEPWVLGLQLPLAAACPAAPAGAAGGAAASRRRAAGLALLAVGLRRLSYSVAAPAKAAVAAADAPAEPAAGSITAGACAWAVPWASTGGGPARRCGSLRGLRGAALRRRSAADGEGYTNWGDFGLTSYEELQALRAFAMAGPAVQERTWLDDLQEQQLLAVLAVALLFLGTIWSILTQMVNPVTDMVPLTRTPSLATYLQRHAPPRPAGNYGGRAPPKCRPAPGSVEQLELRSVESTGDLWEMYSFASRQIVEEVPSMLVERNYVYLLALKLAAFPTVYSNWERYESCAVEEVSLGPTATRLEPVPTASMPQWSKQKEVVLACGAMIEAYGISVIARESGPGSPIAGSLTLRVKRLPEGCHVDDGEGSPSVVCTVPLDDALGANGLEGIGYLESIAVSPSWRGSGLALRLLRFAEEKARAWGLGLLGLHVHRDNWAALRFYQRHGYETTSDWLGWGETFFLLLRPL